MAASILPVIDEKLPDVPLTPGLKGDSDDATSVRKNEDSSSTAAHAPGDGSTRAGEARRPGVSSIEAFARSFAGNRWAKWILGGAILGILVASSLDNTTTPVYSAIASSAYGDHGALLSAISTVTNIMTAIVLPFVAKICDNTSRQTACAVMLTVYVVGYLIVTTSHTANGFAAGLVLSTLGNTGLQFITSIILADLSPLQWRGFATSLSGVPWIWFSFVGPNISGPIIDAGLWRWGYGMFCIITPALVLPALAVLYAAERRARALGDLDDGGGAFSRLREDENSGTHESVFSFARRILTEIDALGLFLLGASLTLLLAPFSIASQQPHGWAEPFIVIMMVLGVVLLVAFGVWDHWFASVPVMSKRISFNSTFVLAVGVNFTYFLGSVLQLVYYSSYVYIVKDWSTTHWGYFNNEVTVAMSAGGLVVGLIMRASRRYKFIQMAGLIMRCLGCGLIYYARGDRASTGALVMGTFLSGLGGACLIGNQVAVQASVPHSDLAQCTALLSLGSTIGSSIGSAVAGAVWTNTMPENLLKEGVPAELVETIYGGLTLVHSEYDLHDPIRQAVVRAAGRTLEPLLIGSLVMAFVGLLCGTFMPNYRLGKTHNIVTNTDIGGRPVDHDVLDELPPLLENESFWQKIKRPSGKWVSVHGG